MVRAAFEAAERLGISGYQVVQNAYSLLAPRHERAVRSICARRELAFTPFSLARGALTRKYQCDVASPPRARDGIAALPRACARPMRSTNVVVRREMLRGLDG